MAGIAGPGYKWLEWLDMAGFTKKLLEMAGMARYGWRLLDIAGHGLKWNWLNTVLVILGVWEFGGNSKWVRHNQVSWSSLIAPR